MYGYSVANSANDFITLEILILNNFDSSWFNEFDHTIVTQLKLPFLL